MSFGKVRLSRGFIECFHSCGRLLWKFIAKKKKASKVLYKKIVQLVLVWETNMAAHSLFWARENSNHYGRCEAMSQGSIVTSCVFPKPSSAGWPRLVGVGLGERLLFPSTHKQPRKLQWGTKVMRHFHKMAPFLYSRHPYPLLLCSPNPLPQKSMLYFKNLQVFLLLQTTLIWGEGC